MNVARGVGALVTVLATAVAGAPPVHAGDEPVAATGGAPAAAAPAVPSAPATNEAPAASETPSPAGGSQSLAPRSAARALAQAAAAYEYGDLAALIAAARPVAEGAFPESSESDRVEALRFLGIGLFLSGRTGGAETAFGQLLELRPDAKLHPDTRPDVIAFFADVKRRRHKPPPLVWSFLPPLGQISNGDTRRAWLVGGAEAVGLVGSIATYVWLKRNQGDDFTFGASPDDQAKDKSGLASKVKALNVAAVVLGVGAYAAGVVDALMRRDTALAEEAQVSFMLFPSGAALSVRF